ncbi:early transcribed membrane protein [Plasmodium vinckei brucechwatti]|uniref:Early transcribed membrane protein n=1 Tax=Plasmodium vinckei brucechwatti TaxID=119398 RepID=A0A6V7RZ01_PLAVN|nr:early transcribed membrane protein [Plasmodium vinckei brucechwatti]
MKLTKAIYFIAFLLAINVLVPGSNNYVQAKSDNSNNGVSKGGKKSLGQLIKDNKAAFISTLLATLAVAAGTTYGAIHYHKHGTLANLFGGKSRKGSSKKKDDAMKSSKGGRSGQKKSLPVLTSVSDGFTAVTILDQEGGRTPAAPYTVKINKNDKNDKVDKLIDNLNH